MASDRNKVMDRLLSAHRGGQKLVLLFDYDGTLVPIVEHPRQAKLSLETRQVLARLARQPRVLLGLISGRALDDLKTMADLADIYYAGSSGLELDLRGVRVTHPQADVGRTRITHLAEILRCAIVPFTGAWLEDKGLGLTAHYRALNPVRIPAFRDMIVKRVEAAGGKFRLVPGPMALEITPALNWNKGSAVQRIVAHAGPGAFPLYAGDDANDQEALEAALNLGGVALAIGPHAPQVCTPGQEGMSPTVCHLQDHVELTEVLATLLKTVEA